MDLDFCTFHANIISRSLAYVEVNTDKPDICHAYLVTRNQRILDSFEIFDFPFKEFDRSTKQLQAVDVRTGSAVVIDLENIETAIIYGDANLLSPPVVGNPMFYDILTEHDIADIQLPFCINVKKTKDEGCYISQPYERKKFIEYEISKFRTFTKEINLVPGETSMYNYLYDEFHNKCNNRLWSYVANHKRHIKFAAIAHILRQCASTLQNETEDFNIDINTFEDVEIFFKNVPKIKAIWKAYLKQLVERQINKLNNEYEEICNTHFGSDTQSREKDFIKIQYDRVIFSLKNTDIDKELDKFGNNVFFLLRYIPSDIDIPKELDGIMLFSSYENHVIDVLYKNGIILDEALFNFDGLDPLWWEYGGILGVASGTVLTFLEQLNNLYINTARDLRFVQIKTHSADIVEMVRQEASDLDEDDIKEIIESMQDFNTYKERLDSFTSIIDVIQYWPSVLLPLPTSVARLGGALHHTIDLHNLISVNS